MVTGLRTPEELLYLKRKFPSAQIVLVEADQRIRFERHIRRARDGEFTNVKSFANEDERQRQFGTLRIARDIAEITILNDGTRDQYCRRIEDTIELISNEKPRRDLNSNRTLSELHRSLKALLSIGAAATCEEISLLTTTLGWPVRTYNTNRALKAVPEFAQRIELKGEHLRYQPTARTASLLALLDLLTGLQRNALP